MAEEMRLNAEDLRTLSYLTDRMEFAAQRLGQRFDGKRDLDKEYGYITDGALNYGHFLQAYRRYSVARRIVRLPAEDTWREPPEIYETEDPEDETEFERAWKGLAQRLSLWHYMERADIVSGIGRFGVLMLEVADGNQSLDQPLPMGLSPESLVGLSVYSDGSVADIKLDEDRSSPRYNLPSVYTINTGTYVSQGASRYRNYLSRTDYRPIRVHWSRVIHVAEDLLEDDIYGEPRLASVFNRLDDLEKVAGAAGESFFQRAAMHLAFIRDPNSREPTATAVTSEKEQIDEYTHHLRRVLRLAGTTIENLSPEIADPRGTVEVLTKLISGTKGIPLRLLFGSERGDLASTQDRSNWADQVMRRQGKHAEPRMLRPFIDRCIRHGFLPTPSEYTVGWKPQQVLNELERAQMQESISRAVFHFARQGSVAAPGRIVSDSEAREQLGWTGDLPEESESLGQDKTEMGF